MKTFLLAAFAVSVLTVVAFAMQEAPEVVVVNSEVLPSDSLPLVTDDGKILVPEAVNSEVAVNSETSL